MSQTASSENTQLEGRISVVIPCYNYAHYVAQTVESALSQQHVREIIVVDDGSTDNSAQVVREVAAKHPQVTLLQQKNQGQSTARNTGFSHSSGEFVVFIDADDLFAPDAFEAQLRMLEENPQCVFTFGHIQLIDADGKWFPTSFPFRPVTRHFLRESLRAPFILTPAAILFRRSLLLEMGPFTKTYDDCEDHDMILRILEKHPICATNHLVALYRRHGNNVSNRSLKMARTFIRVQMAHWPHIKHDRALRRACLQGMWSVVRWNIDKARSAVEVTVKNVARPVSRPLLKWIRSKRA